MAGIDDQFLGIFITIVTLGLIIGPQMARYILGSHRETMHFQLLSGMNLGPEEDYFWPIYIATSASFTMLALFIIMIQNAVGKYKEWKLTQNVQINLREVGHQNDEEIAEEEEPNVTVHCFYNNAKYDVSLLNGKEIAVAVTLFFVGLIFFYSISIWARNANDQMIVYKWHVIREFFITFGKIFNPWTYLFAKKKTLVYG